MLGDPPLNQVPTPDSSYGELGFREREVGVALHQLVDPLPGDPKHDGDLRNAHEVLTHTVIVRKNLTATKDHL